MLPRDGGEGTYRNDPREGRWTPCHALLPELMGCHEMLPFPGNTKSPSLVNGATVRFQPVVTYALRISKSAPARI